MFSPVYFEKLGDFIECLDLAVDMAHEHSKEIGLDSLENVDLTPVCSKCYKRKRLKFDNSISGPQQDSYYSRADNSNQNSANDNDSILTSQLNRDLSPAKSVKDPLSSAIKDKHNDVTKGRWRRHNSLRTDKKNIDSTFMSTIMKTLVTLNSSSESLNRSTEYLNENLRSKKKGILKRRHTMLVDTSLMLSANANAAVTFARNNPKGEITNRESDKCGEKKDTVDKAIYRSNVTRKPRPYSYPNRQCLQRQSTAPVLAIDKSQLGAKTDLDVQEKKEKINDMVKLQELDISDDFTSESLSNNSFLNSNTDEKLIAVKVEGDHSGSTSPHEMYYSLSPTLLDSPLRIEDLRKSTVSAVKVKVKEFPKDTMFGLGDKTNELEMSRSSEESSMLSNNSSLSSNPEYFAVVSKSKRKLNRWKRIDQSENIGDVQTRSLPAKMSHDLTVAEDINLECDKKQAQSNRTSVRMSSLHGGDSLNLKMDKKRCSNFKNKQDYDDTIGLDSITDGSLVNGSTSCHHGDGLLYTSSFGIGDHGMCKSLGESDMLLDGYCKCSFCNHEMIITPLKSETVNINSKTDLSEVDRSQSLHLESFTMADFSMTSLRSPGHDMHSDLQADHFPYPRLPKEFMTSQCDSTDLNLSQYMLDTSMNVSCSCDEDSGAEDENSARVSPIQKALQRDIEKHSSGVASVLNLCEVLLHDGDACSTKSDKDSIQQATDSLDRRWRNICSLSMERKLKIEDTQRLWQKFMEDYSRFNGWLRSAEHVVSHPNTYMICYQVAREELKKFESFQRQVHESLTQLELINKQYRRLARENRTDATNKLKNLIHSANSRWDVLSHRVTCILRRLKHLIRRREDFETRRESLQVWLTETDLRLTNVEHFMQCENYDKLKEVKNFQAAIEEHIPLILHLDTLGTDLILKSEETDCVSVEEELIELHRYCREVISRLDKYHKRLLKIMNEPPPLDSSLFEDTELSQMDWFENYINESSSSRNSSPGLLDRDHSNLTTPRSRHSARLHGSAGSHSGRATPESLEWDLYDISQSELETKDNGALSDDASIPEMSPLETANDDDIPLLHVSRDSTVMSERHSTFNSSRRTHDHSTSREFDLDDITPAKKSRSSQDGASQQNIQFSNDLDATLAWLDATEKVTHDEMSDAFDKTINQLHREFKAWRGLQESIKQRRAIVLSINLVSSNFIDSDVTIKLSRMNKQWESLQQTSVNWCKNLQEGVKHSQEFQVEVSELSSWVTSQNHRRDDMSMTQHKDSADSSPSSTILHLRKNHKSLDHMRIETLEAISKVSVMQEMCNQLSLPADGDRHTPVEGVRTLSDKVRTLNSQLRTLLDAVRSDLKDVEHKIKATRRRAREEHSSASESESSTDTPLRASTPIRLRMLQRKVEPSELHSSGRDANLRTTSVRSAEDNLGNFNDYDVTRESCSSIDSLNYDVTHRSLHSRSKDNKQNKMSKATVVKSLASKQTVVATEHEFKAKTVAMSVKHTATASAFYTTKTVKSKPVAGFCCRVCVAAFPFYILMLLLFLLPWLLQATVDDGFGCLRQNNYAFSLTPMLSYTNGPPPV